MTKRSSPWSVAEARRIVKKHAASGLSASAFARRQGFDDARLHRWRRHFASELDSAGTPAIVELRSERRRVEAVEIVLASGVTLRVAETIDPSALARLITVLR